MRRLLALAVCLAAPATAQNTDPVVPGPTSGGDSAANPVAATPAAARLAAAEQHRQLAERSPVAEVGFRSVGPTVMSGRVAAVAGKPGDPATFYVAYASGGLWRTANGGHSSTPVFDHQPTITLGDVAVDWRDPEGDGPTVWVGTGEANSSRSSYAGTGVYRSTDGGDSWAHLGLAETHHIGSIVLGDEPGTAWVAAVGHLYSPNPERGVYRTVDGGASWTRVLFVDNPEGDGAANDTGAIDLVRAGDGRLYASTWTRSRRAWDFREAGPGSAIWASDDDGVTWIRLTTPGSGFPTGADVGRIGVDVHPSGVVYAVVDNQARRPKDPAANEPTLTSAALVAMTRDEFLAVAEEDLNAFLDANNVPYSYTAETILEDVREGRISPRDLVDFLGDANASLFDTPVVGAQVYRSDDRGQSWRLTHEGTLDDLFYSYGYYFSVVRVDPNDVDRLYVLGVPLVGSVDGGATWQRADAPHVHVDHHDLWLDAASPGYMLSGNDGGANVTWDYGATWTKLNTTAVGQFYTVQTDNATPYNVYGGLQDNGVWAGPSDYRPSPAWRAEGDYPYRRLFGGDGMQVQVDPRDGTVYTGFQFGNYARIDGGRGQAERIVPEHVLGERPFRYNWQTPIWLSTHLPDVLYLGSHKLHRSYDRGETWAAISGDLTGGPREGDVPYGTLTSIHESPLEFGLLAAGSDDGFVWVTEDAGRTWRDASAGLPADLWVSRVELSGHDRDRLLVSLNGYRWDHFESYIYTSDDLGRTWRRIGLDIPAEPVNVAREDPNNPDGLFVGTDGGLYVSLDRGVSFTAFHGDRAPRDAADGPDNGFRTATLPRVPVHDLVVQARDRDLVVGTHGRSIWIADLNLVSQLTPQVQSSRLHLFAPDTTTHQENWGDRGYAWAEPAEPSVELAYWTTETGTARVRVLSANGQVLRQWDDGAEPGINLLAYDLRSDREPGEAGDATEAFYLEPGAYTLEVRLAGQTETAPLVVEAGPEPPSRARKKMP